jgi:hypothetical protein
VDIAILHQDLKHFTGFAFEQAVVGKHDCGATSWLQGGQYVQNKVELLVDVWIVKSSRPVLGLLLWFRKADWSHDVVSLATERFVDPRSPR